MKLKKIASLMLAGIMAVSMLAACGEGKDNGGNAGSSSSQPTTSGIVAEVQNGIKVYNDDLKIDVKGATSLMASGLDKAFKENVYEKLISVNGTANDPTIRDALRNAFDHKITYAECVTRTGYTGALVDTSQLTTINSKAENYAWGVIPVEKVSNASADTAVGNLIGMMFKDVENETKFNLGGENVTAETSYTMYVYSGSMTTETEKSVPAVVFVVVANSSVKI